jgi:hypothetical protein
MKYMRKVEIVEVIEVKGNVPQIIKFMGGEAQRNILFSIDRAGTRVKIATTRGMLQAREKDFIVKTDSDNFFVMSPEDFKRKYERYRG